MNEPNENEVYTGTDIFYDVKKRDIQFVGNEIATMSQIENIRNQLYLRLLCEKGELIYYPEYGTNLYRMLSKSMTPAQIQKIEGEVRDTIMQDPRVDNVQSVTVEVGKDDVVIITARVTVQDITFDLVLEEAT
ncbi:Phage baseplate assembly protein W [Aneurinibacillus thermoaerophilus]|uniref:DUF2634 domain-containing protein n=1 Tax=Aneurinibacillus thermoaerophilus TaxID=143495 RepID=A0A1G8FCC5_ANETH|nr:DUF2634 domain-containing protein [Aneurinibacillus thermoaerophilus]QYY44789.1 DUF2634 domain-containing protein [Aneurinibacillus thermoaerophilus]SDH79753.1 Phage baseplate assembly protein W [Aneurinibacillus thermoaerophilus]